MPAFVGSAGGGGTRVGAPHEGVTVPAAVICKGGKPAGAGKMWVKDKFVN